MAKDVVVYSSDTCGYCVALKDYLTENNVSFTEKNISTDPEARQELVTKGHMGVPVTVIDGTEEIVGFDRDKINASLGI